MAILIRLALSAVLCAVLTTGLFPQTGQATEAPAVRDGIFIHISQGANDPHRVLMPLKMAELMADSRDVLIYFDIKGVEVVLKDAEDIVYSHFPTSKKQLKALLAAGVEMHVCPGCLKAAGKTAKDVMAGVKIANKDRFFSFTKGRILTLDY
jgi:predicted peroxiredoxin